MRSGNFFSLLPLFFFFFCCPEDDDRLDVSLGINQQHPAKKKNPLYLLVCFVVLSILSPLTIPADGTNYLPLSLGRTLGGKLFTSCYTNERKKEPVGRIRPLTISLFFSV